LPGVGAASNKKDTAAIFKLMQKFHPSEFDFAPRTFNMPEDQAVLQEFMKANPKKTFICKPDGGAEGCGILLAQKYKDLPRFVFEQPYVV
jgi:hypothetical protein